MVGSAVDGADPAVADLRELVTVGLARGRALLTAGEEAIARRVLTLDGDAARLYARLSGRVPEAFHLPSLALPGPPLDVPAAAARLHEVELADGLVPWPTRARLVPRAVLVEVLRANRRPTTGRKAELVARMADLQGWIAGPWLRIRHRALLRRLTRFALLRPHADRSTLVVARLGIVRWPTYPITPGAGLFPTRRALRAWEALADAPELGVDDALRALHDGTARGPAGLDLHRALVRAVRHHAASVERADPAAAAALYRAIVAPGWERVGKVAVRWSRCEERRGDAATALDVLVRGRRDALPSEHVAISRAGRRLGRALGAGIPPAPPLQAPRRREIRLHPAEPARGRPRWSTPAGPLPVELAVAATLARLGRTALLAEGAPFSTLFAALCADLWFLPVPGALPVPFLAAPLDLGAPGSSSGLGFRAARRDAVDALLARLDAGEGPSLAAAGDDRWRGTRLAGARWDVVERETLVALAGGLGPRGLRVVVEALLDHGPRAAAGLPDLVVLPGPAVRIADALPASIGPGLVLAEVKGPSDAVRDEQAVWHDRLVRAGAPLEVWTVGPHPSGRTAGDPR